MSEAKSVQSNAFERVEDLLDGRPGFRLTGEWGHVSMLEGGGHICDLVSSQHPEINPLWRPQWKTMEPYQYDAVRDGSAYGPLPDGRLLAGLAGHSLSFDHFEVPTDFQGVDRVTVAAGEVRIVKSKTGRTMSSPA